MTMTPSNAVRTAAAAVLALFASADLALAADAPPKPPTAQQRKMGECNAAAAGKTGDARKAFMSDCLKHKPVAAAQPTQRERMARCNKESAGKKGDERKAFMSSCLRAVS